MSFLPVNFNDSFRSVLKGTFTILFFFSLSILSFSQSYDDEGNKKPKITGQRELSTEEEQSITVQMLDLQVEDHDDLFYPIGFTMQLYTGSHYSLSGNTVTPAKDFTGVLTVPVTVNDGEDDSPKYDLRITVNNINDAPVIVSQQSVGTTAGEAITLQLSFLSVNDPDDAYPSDFTLKVLSGDNYTVSGNEVTPHENYQGTLTVGVRVNDGSADSETFNFSLNVAARSTEPVIKNQAPVIINEDEVYSIQLADLSVSDPQHQYPQGFTINVYGGDNYEYTGTTITPFPDYHGNLFVPLTVTNGQETSEPFVFQIAVRSVNDAPVVVLPDTSAVRVRFGDAPLSLFSNIDITDVDHDSLSLAEITFLDGTFIEGTDILTYPNNGTSPINGIFDPHSGVFALIGKASLQEYITALNAIAYQLGAEETSGRLSTTLGLSVSDGQSSSKRVVKPISFSDLISGSFEIPTGFTPNGDAVNDTWGIKPLTTAQNYDGALVRVYSKSGLLVFEGTGLTTEWDGKYNGTILPPDVYFYTVNFNTINKKANLKGMVTILR
jgi:gliding motility-associated-like protein